MNLLKYGFFYFLETALRFVPIPQKTRLIKIGKPDRNTPVLVTGNYHLTVLKARRALEGQNAYLLVADSHGINVWCAAAGGHFTHHDVIRALKLSGIERLVDHRAVVLPQLAACGVEARFIEERTDWKVKWGPVDIRDFGDYREGGQKKTIEMSVVRFPLSARIEMAAAWAFWMSAFYALILLFIDRSAVLPAVIMVWILSLLVFFLFPLYLPLLRPKKKERGGEKRPTGRWVFFVSFLFFVLAGVAIFGLLIGNFSADFLLFWGIAAAAAALMLGGDLAGSTPVLISEFREEKGLRVEVDAEKCRGDGVCLLICPADCFTLDERKRMAVLERPEKCIGCGACIVQCRFDALSYAGEKGRRITADNVRKHRIGLSGKRKSR
jgi:NAD-dependent dihydropyrimidine dehydrogenase PreA subunit